MRLCVFSCLCFKRTCKSLKAKHPKWQRKGGNMQSYLHVSWWYLVLQAFLQPCFLKQQLEAAWFLQWLRCAKTKLSQKWMGKEKVQDNSCMPETNCVNIFLSLEGMFLLMSCELVVLVTDLCKIRPFLSLMPIVWFTATLISTTRLHPPQYILTSCPTAWPPTGSIERQKEQRGREAPPNKIQMEFLMRYLGATKMLLLLYRKKQKCGHTCIIHNEELTNCSDRVCRMVTNFLLI